MSENCDFFNFRQSLSALSISDVNKEKRIGWCLDRVLSKLSDVTWTDECSVQLESHRKIRVESFFKDSEQA